jgi:Tape measure protein
MYGFSFGIQNLTQNPLDVMLRGLSATTVAADALNKQLKGLGDVSKKVGKDSGDSLGNIGKLGGGIKGLIAPVLATIGIQQLGSEIIGTLSKFEKFEAVLTNTLGSNSAAQQILRGINDFAAKTPFQVDELTDSFVKFANQGFAPSLVEMRKLGDLASSTGKGFNQLTEAVIDASVGEYERLKEFGIQAGAVKGTDLVTVAFKGQTKTIKEGGESLRKYLLGLGDMKGVAGSMEAISKTTGGQISNLKDSVGQLYLALGESLKPIITDVLGGFASGLSSTM